MNNKITIVEAARMLGVGRWWVTKLIYAGRIKAEKFGCVWAVDEASVRAFVRSPRGRPKKVKVAS